MAGVAYSYHWYRWALIVNAAEADAQKRINSRRTVELTTPGATYKDLLE